jgi:hypothetical protein
MTINVSINGNKLFEWEGNAEEVGEIDEWVRELARDKGVTPELVAQAAMVGVLKNGRLRTFTRRDAILVWKLLSQPTGNPDHPGFYRDYIEVWDFDIDIDANDPERLNIKVGARMQGGEQWSGLN